MPSGRAAAQLQGERALSIEAKGDTVGAPLPFRLRQRPSEVPNLC